MRNLHLFVLGLACLCTSFTLYSAPDFSASHYARQNYINRYHQVAVQEMLRSGIPASITLAQGILESNSGEGDLALSSNNHFGIKCNDNWTGETFEYYDDDTDKNGKLVKSCFRVYADPYQSYQDHTDFLSNRKYYRELFNLDATDYEKWAHGLKRCGYATDKLYGHKLISIIERHELYKYDLASIPQAPPVGIPLWQDEIDFMDAPAITNPQEVIVENYSPATNPIITDFMRPEDFYEDQFTTSASTVFGNPYAGEKEVTVTPIPDYSYEEIFVLNDPIYEDEFTASAPVALAEMDKPVIHYPNNLGHFNAREIVLKAPGYNYIGRTVRYEEWQTPVVSEPVFEVEVTKPSVRPPATNQQYQLQSTEQKVEWENVEFH